MITKNTILFENYEKMNNILIILFIYSEFDSK
jgi:hypothetical protein